jgi:hypothetical protein
MSIQNQNNLCKNHTGISVSLLTNTHSVGFIDLVSVVTCAHETAKGIGAAAIFTQVIHFRTFFNVFQNDLRVRN